MGVCNCSRFCCTLLYIHSSIAIILMGKGELVALLGLSPGCLVMVEWLFLVVPWGCLQFVIVVFPDHTHLLFSIGFQLHCKKKERTWVWYVFHITFFEYNSSQSWTSSWIYRNSQWWQSGTVRIVEGTVWTTRIDNETKVWNQVPGPLKIRSIFCPNSMSMKYHNHTMQINPWHHEGEPQST